MKIYYISKNNSRNKKEVGIPTSFCGLVSIDIGYRTCGITILTPQGRYKTIDCKPISKDINLAKLSIPNYYTVALKASRYFETLIQKNPKLLSYAWSMEVPNIIGSYAPALCILLSTLSTRLLELGIPIIFYTGNRLGGFFLKKRSYTKTEIKKFVKEQFNISTKITDHEADSILQAYSIYKGVYNKYIDNVKLRDFEVTFERL